ncbi:phosphotransferase [Candidatus Woesearchaeota archaeon]|nr:phosphotransferase [Candidatus Woesearchaeota archaeon]
MEKALEKIQYADISQWPDETHEMRPKAIRATLGMRPMSMTASVAPPAKPKEVLLLEQLLSQAYNEQVSVTRVRPLVTSRKEVKEVYFCLGQGVSKVWVFKADPKTTMQELNAYHIVYQQGIPTGKPIAYEPSTEPYPFDVALLGGVIEHAGEPYTTLLEQLEYSPEVMAKTAVHIARLIADYHVKLTAVQQSFANAGITLTRASPRKELRERLLAARGISEPAAERLISACEQLALYQVDNDVVSHGDIHTNNIVTIATPHHVTKQLVTSVEQFGVIDWGSLVLDKPYGDLQDFYIHHCRKAASMFPTYKLPFEMLEDAYADQLTKHGLVFQHSDADSLIQAALWHLYEIDDPTRSQNDREDKAVYHRIRAEEKLDALARRGYAEAAVIKTELDRLS